MLKIFKNLTKFCVAGCLVLGLNTNSMAQDGYGFKDVKILKTTSVKDQNRSGTCWSFSTLSFIESEMIRMGKGEADLSEMYVVWNCYSDKAKLYVRMHGHLNFGGGGAIHDALNVIRDYGMMPEEAFKGLNYGEDNHVHGEMDVLLKAYVDAVIKNKNRKLTPVWQKGFDAVLNSYLGSVPEKFTYKGKEYTPRTYADNVVGIKPEDYRHFSSYTHHPFYEQFVMEVPDNWAWGQVHNVKMEEMTEIMDNAIKSGYTINWASDVSEKGFSFRNGVCIVPEDDIKEMADSERTRWEKLTPSERKKMIFDEPRTEKKITQEMRQKAFDNYQTTDDHGMHIVGIAKDKNGKEYYKVKNSWADDSNSLGGYFYVSKAFVKYKTMSFTVHKDAVPKNISKKLK